jgi:2,4-dienoyl-CoA reductase-like NADH-dependent reductase (Old Yellow Enzyme family)
MSFLFESWNLGLLEVKNRFMRSATTSYWSDENGIVRSEIIRLYRQLGKGGIGLIVKGHLFVSDSGKSHVGMAGISNKAHLSELQKLVNEVHKYDSKIIAQLNHGGIYSIVERVGPSVYISKTWKARSLSSDEINDIVGFFGDAAARAVEAGFDGVQIHGAHGYLISQFLSRLVNKRRDKWGGSLENRARLLFGIYKEIRKRLGNDVPILLKMNCDDFSPDGFTIDDSIWVAEAICKLGLDAIEISGEGVGAVHELRARARSNDEELSEAVFAGYASRIREVALATPVALVEGIRSLTCMNAIIEKGVADIISMSRPFIKEPDIVRRLKSGQSSSTCNSCNLCGSDAVFAKMMLRCHLNEDIFD